MSTEQIIILLIAQTVKKKAMTFSVMRVILLYGLQYCTVHVQYCSISLLRFSFKSEFRI